MRAFFLATGPGKKNKKTIISESYVMRVYSVLSAPLYLLHYLLIDSQVFSKNKDCVRWIFNKWTFKIM